MSMECERPSSHVRFEVYCGQKIHLRFFFFLLPKRKGIFKQAALHESICGGLPWSEWKKNAKILRWSDGFVRKEWKVFAKSNYKLVKVLCDYACVCVSARARARGWLVCAHARGHSSRTVPVATEYCVSSWLPTSTFQRTKIKFQTYPVGCRQMIYIIFGSFFLLALLDVEHAEYRRWTRRSDRKTQKFEIVLACVDCINQIYEHENRTRCCPNSQWLF